MRLEVGVVEAVEAVEGANTPKPTIFGALGFDSGRAIGRGAVYTLLFHMA